MVEGELFEILGMGRQIVRKRDPKAKFQDEIWIMVVVGWVEEDLKDRKRDSTCDKSYFGEMLSEFISRCFFGFEK